VDRHSSRSVAHIGFAYRQLNAAPSSASWLSEVNTPDGNCKIGQWGAPLLLLVSLSLFGHNLLRHSQETGSRYFAIVGFRLGDVLLEIPIRHRCG
jgi:hypothetical protein